MGKKKEAQGGVNGKIKGINVRLHGEHNYNANFKVPLHSRYFILLLQK